MLRHVLMISAIGLTATASTAASAQRTSVAAQRISRALTDSAEKANGENNVAVLTSGVWKVDGEYKGTQGEYYKLSGAFAYVSSTSATVDNGDAAVIAMYLEPMAGGTTTWYGARLGCTFRNKVLVCYALEGAKGVLDLNIIFKNMPIRGQSAEAEITEPDDKSADRRWTSRSTVRGRFTLRVP